MPSSRAFRWLLAGGVFALAGCSESLLRSDFQGMRLAMAHKPQAHPTAESVARLPYPQLLLEYAGNSAVLVLGNDDDGRQSWYSHDRKIVYLQRDGLLIGSRGLVQGDADIHIDGDEPLAKSTQSHTPVTITHRYDWMPGYRYGVTLTGAVQPIGEESVDILGTSHALLHLREHLQGAGVDANNDYWIDPQTGFIWKSRQLLMPGVMLTITQLKPYLPAGAR